MLIKKKVNRTLGTIRKERPIQKYFHTIIYSHRMATSLLLHHVLVTRTNNGMVEI